VPYPNPTVAGQCDYNNQTCRQYSHDVKNRERFSHGCKIGGRCDTYFIATKWSAGGDLSGTYPNPTIGVDAITTTKILDGSVTAAKLAVGTIPTSLPPIGTAGGDLNGTYPNPTIGINANHNKQNLRWFCYPGKACRRSYTDRHYHQLARQAAILQAHTRIQRLIKYRSLGKQCSSCDRAGVEV
jgi:hypothetical protein